LAAKIEFSYEAVQTVNLLAYAFSGSNPLLPKLLILKQLRTFSRL
jgi:hypothetical protein